MLKTARQVAVLLSLALPTSARALWEDHTPFTKAELAKRFAVKHLGELNTRNPRFELPVGPSGGIIETKDGEVVVVFGRDKKGVDWQVYIDGHVLRINGYLTILLGDLDNNGQQDLILTIPTTRNGLAPPLDLYTLMFDSSGRPVPFSVPIYLDYEYTLKELTDLLDLDGDGQAELATMSFDDGYWITNLYKANDARWEHVRKLGKRNFPLYTRFTKRPNHNPVTPNLESHPIVGDYSNTKPSLTGRIKTWDLQSSPENFLIADDHNVGQQTCSLPLWFILDEPIGRRIFEMTSVTDQATDSILKEIVDKRYAVALYGQQRFRVRGEQQHQLCSPVLIWANP